MKQDRNPRTSINLDRVRPSGPTQQSRLIERSVPQPEARGTTLGAISQAFDGFFNFSADFALEKSAQVAAEAKEDELLRLQSQAARDFTESGTPNPAMANNREYNHAFSGMVGERDGRRLSAELATYLNELPIGESAFDAGDAWIRENYGNGTGDDIVDGIAFKYMKDTINAAVESRTNIRLENTLQVRINTLSSTVGEFVASGEELNADTFNTWVNLYAGANPKDAPAAKAKVMGMIFDASNGNERGLSSLDRFLNEPGTGNGDQSFAQSFPAPYDALQQKMINAQRSTQTLRAENAYNDVSSAVGVTTSLSDLSPLVETLEMVRQEHGPGSHYESIRTAIVKRAGELAETEEVNTALGAFIRGQGSLAPRGFDKDVRDAIPAAISEAGGAVLTDDVNARRAAVALHLNLPKTADSIRDQLASGLMGVNETARVQAYNFAMDYALMKAENGQPNFTEAANKFFFGNESARALFIRIAKADLVSDEGVSDLINQYVSSPGINPNKVSLREIDENLTDARSAINDRIADVLGNMMDRGILFDVGPRDLDVEDIDPMVLQHIRDRFKFLWGRAGARGDTWEEDLDAVTQAAVADLSYTLRDGQKVVTFAKPMRALTQRGYRDVKPLAHDAVSPITGAVEDTIGAAQDNLAVVAEALGYDSDDVGLEPGAATRGYYPIRLDGVDPIFALGGGTPMPDGSTLALPDYPEAAVASLREVIGEVEGVDFEVVDINGITALRMVYRPVWKTGSDIAEDRLAEVQALREQRAASLESGEEQDRAISDLQLGRARLSTSADVPDFPVLRNQQSVMEDFQSELNRSARTQGNVPASTGITTPAPQTLEELQTLQDQHRGSPERIKASPSYIQSRLDFLKESEGFRTTAYDDHKGIVTVGIGFNMEAAGARDRWEKALPDVSFDKVRDGKARLNDAQVKRLFDVSVEEAEDVVDNRLGRTPLTEHQRAALVSLAFNSPGLIGPNLTGFIKEGDLDSVVMEILFRSNRTGHKGLQNRRIEEAQMFAGRANPLPTDLIQESLAAARGKAVKTAEAQVAEVR